MISVKLDAKYSIKLKFSSYTNLFNISQNFVGRFENIYHKYEEEKRSGFGEDSILR